MADSNIQTLDTVKPITLDEYQERTAHLQENTTSLLSTIADKRVQAAGLATQAASLASEVNAVAEQASLSFSKKTWTDTATSGTPITAAELNRLENAISSLTTAVNNLQDSVSRIKFIWRSLVLNGPNWSTAMTASTIASMFGITTDKIVSQIVLIYVNGDISAFSGSILGAFDETSHNLIFKSNASLPYRVNYTLIHIPSK